MTNVVQFRGRFSSKVDGPALTFALVWAPLSELRAAILVSDDPVLVCKVVRVIADGLLEKQLTDADARTHGWHSAAAIHERGRDMLLLLQEFESGRT